MDALHHLEDRIESLPAKGRYTFGRQEAEAALRSSFVATQSALRRQKQKGRLVSAAALHGAGHQQPMVRRPDAQRLGYVLEQLGEKRLAGSLAAWLVARRTTIVPLRPDPSRRGSNRTWGYLAPWLGVPVTRARMEANLAAKMRDAAFVGDVRPLLRPGLAYDGNAAWREVHQRIVTNLPGRPWRGMNE